MSSTPTAPQAQVGSTDVSDNLNMLHNNNDDELVDLENMELVSKSNRGKKHRKLISPVWNFFEHLPISEDGRQRCKCKKCSAIYICDSKFGTGNLKRHIKTCQRSSSRDIGQLLLSQSQESMSLSSDNKFDPEVFRELVAAAVVMHDLPFQFVEYDGIRAVLKYLRADLHLISRNTVKADVLRMYKREKGKIKEMLELAPGRISLISDLWTSCITDGYISLTAYFLDSEWVLHKRILNFCFLTPPHNGISLAEKVYSLLVEWGIEKKIFSITLDNASVNDFSVELLRHQLNIRNTLVCGGEFLHLRCCCHVLNLIVQDGLKDIDDAIQKIRESIKYVKASQSREQIFLECANHMSIETKKGLRQDCPARWNSTYMMLESALCYQHAFCHLELSDSNYKHCPSIDEWEKATKILKFLAVFYDATCMFSRSKYPTANLYFRAAFVIYLSLTQYMRSDDEYMKRMSTQMFAKFSNYWSEFSTILAIACVLDPRYKLSFVEFSYKKLFGNGCLEFAQVREKLFSLFNEYMVKSSPNPSSSSPMARGSALDVDDRQNLSYSQEVLDVMKEFDSFESEECSLPMQKSQLELYLDEPRLQGSKLDILAFWKANQYKYPELATMARDILSIPISTVASESAFSVGGRVLDQYRSALKPDTMQALICVRDWLYGLKDSAITIASDELAEDIVSISSNAGPPQPTEDSGTIHFD